ncbi:MAG: adenylate cyclase [Glaciecola sp.]
MLNILPVEIAAELNQFGSDKIKRHASLSVLFADFKGFKYLSIELTAEELVGKLDEIFVAFDDVIERNSLEKIKTIGDTYMCASGVPESNPFQERNIVIAGLQLLNVMDEFNQK